MTRMTGPHCAVMCILINIHTYMRGYVQFNKYIHTYILRGYVQFNKYIHTYIHTYIHVASGQRFS